MAIDKGRAVPTWSAALTLGILSFIVLTGCAQSVSSTDPGTATTAARIVPWKFRPGEEKRCSEKQIQDRIAHGKALNVESSENSVLDTPEHVKEMKVPEAQYREQVAEWEKLSADDRIYQLCLAVDQDFDRS